MSDRPTVTVPTEIEETRLELENWRRERKRGQHLPEDLWGKAVELARQHGVWPIARALKVDYNRLKRRAGAGAEGGAMKAATAFVELIPQGTGHCACVVEMEDARGARMRIEVKGAAPDMTALSRTFWGERA